MRNLPILTVVMFLLGGSGSGCMAAPQTSAQLSAKLPNVETSKPRTPSPNPSKNPNPSPFVPGVSLPVFPGITPASSPTTIPTTPAAPLLPLVEVPTPGLRVTKVKDSSSPSSSAIKRRQVVDKTPPPTKKRLKQHRDN